MVHVFYSWRIRTLKGSWWIVAAVMVLSVVQCITLTISGFGVRSVLQMQTYQPNTFCSCLGVWRSIFRLSGSRHWISHWFWCDIHQYCKPACSCVILFMLIWVLIFEVVVSWKYFRRHNHCNNSPISSAKYCSPYFPLTLMVHSIAKAPSTHTVSNKDGKSHECCNRHWDDHCNCNKHRAVAFLASSKQFGTFCHVRDIGCITSLADYCTTVRFYALPKLWDINTYASLANVHNYSMIGTQIVWCRLSMVAEMASTKTALGWMYGLNGALTLMATHTRRKRWQPLGLVSLNAPWTSRACQTQRPQRSEPHQCMCWVLL